MAVKTRGRSDVESGDSRPTSDAYVGMLVISLVAMIAACVLLYLDYSQYPEQKAPNPSPLRLPAPQAQDGGGGAPVPPGNTGGNAPAPMPM